MSELEIIYKKIEGYRDEIIQLQRGLTSRIALAPENEGTGEHEKAAMLKEWLKPLNPDRIIEIHAPDERARDGYRPNVIAFWKGQEGAPVIWIVSHLDVVPPGNPASWRSDPYQILVEEDEIYGRGVEDDQHGIVSSLMAIKAVMETGAVLRHSVALAFVADEETGSRYGVEYLIENRPDLFGHDDLIFVPDSGNEEGTHVSIGEKGRIALKFSVKGKQCHASVPGKGNNSLYGVARLIIALQELKEAFDLSDRLYSPPCSTFEPTKIEANVPNVNTIPGLDVFYMDCRILPQYPIDAIVQTVKAICTRIEEELHLQVELEILKRDDPAPVTSSEAPAVKVLCRTIREITGREPTLMGMGGSTVAAFFRRKGLPAVVWSTMNDTAHQANEHCSIKDIIVDAKIFASLFLG